MIRYRIEIATSHSPADRRVRLVTAPTEQAACRIALQRETARLRRLLPNDSWEAQIVNVGTVA